MEQNGGYILTLEKNHSYSAKESIPRFYSCYFHLILYYYIWRKIHILSGYSWYSEKYELNSLPMLLKGKYFLLRLLTTALDLCWASHLFFLTFITPEIVQRNKIIIPLRSWEYTYNLISWGGGLSSPLTHIFFCKEHLKMTVLSPKRDYPWETENWCILEFMAFVDDD